MLKFSLMNDIIFFLFLLLNHLVDMRQAFLSRTSLATVFLQRARRCNTGRHCIDARRFLSSSGSGDDIKIDDEETNSKIKVKDGWKIINLSDEETMTMNSDNDPEFVERMMKRKPKRNELKPSPLEKSRSRTDMNSSSSASEFDQVEPRSPPLKHGALVDATLRDSDVVVAVDERFSRYEARSKVSPVRYVPNSVAEHEIRYLHNIYLPIL